MPDPAPVTITVLSVRRVSGTFIATHGASSLIQLSVERTRRQCGDVDLGQHRMQILELEEKRFNSPDVSPTKCP
jgi:hypothetical protein